jgi:predicted amidohydrolase
MVMTRRDTLALAALLLATPAFAARSERQKGKLMGIDSYMALALQLTTQSVSGFSDVSAARQQMAKTIERIGGQLRASMIFVAQYSGAPVKLVVLPEYFLTSFPGRDSIDVWAQKAAIAVDGPEYESLGKIAQDNKIYLSGNAYETDTHFPGLYFQTSFILDPAGKVVLRYRRLNSMFAPTPHDVWEKYLDIYGLGGVFPVARTEIGNLAAIASEEILYPEIARCLALRGAEVFVHSSSEVGSPNPTHKAIARRARAFENLAYVVSANTAGISGTAMPLASADGNSVMIDYKGAILAESNSGETFTAFGEVDLAALRRNRRKPGMTNYLSRQRLELFAQSYATLGTQPANSMIDSTGKVAPLTRDGFTTRQQAIIDDMIKKGTI